MKNMPSFGRRYAGLSDWINDINSVGYVIAGTSSVDTSTSPVAWATPKTKCNSTTLENYQTEKKKGFVQVLKESLKKVNNRLGRSRQWETLEKIRKHGDVYDQIAEDKVVLDMWRRNK